MTKLKDLIRLIDEPGSNEETPSLDTGIGFCTSPFDRLEVLSIYYDADKDIIWFDLGEKPKTRKRSKIAKER